ncbi:CYTH domain-containing protein [Nodularia harveyana UHCC-0300]|uniref:CYTH domain-containing protein n=1 Tax=Nodularia harveyana UHCC-0300 TaxID=2974287 RepID=A0ABU5UHS4_9CYAN|nr:CYTH domain-containing protein [Nodularia harveyana]MEA5582774.1 CYTH domain-containing protein [Nodularia harveyana UHCC-0300]
MPQEIERKYLLKEDSWRESASGTIYCQGYIATKDQTTVRVRIVGKQGYLTIKGPSVECSRLEFEYLIPVEDAEEMLNTLCQRPFITKTRYKIKWGDLIWEIDEFHGLNEGLIIAEVELTDPEQQIELPPWIGEEVSHDHRYFNSYLVKHPFSEW